MGMYEMPARSDELYHYGVMGMHWGVRRYQNPDGTLTAAGRRKYNIGEAKKTLKASKRNKSAAYDKYRTTSQRVALTPNQWKKKTEDVKSAKKEWSAAKSEYQDAKANYKQVKEENKFHFSDKQKKALKIGATVVAAGLAAYGGYKIAKNLSDNKKLANYYKNSKKAAENLDWDSITSTAKKINNDQKESTKTYYQTLGDVNGIIEQYTNNVSSLGKMADASQKVVGDQTVEEYTKELLKKAMR